MIPGLFCECIIDKIGILLFYYTVTTPVQFDKENIKIQKKVGNMTEYDRLGKLDEWLEAHQCNSTVNNQASFQIDAFSTASDWLIFQMRRFNWLTVSSD